MEIYVVLGYWEDDTEIFKAFKTYEAAEKYVLETLGATLMNYGSEILLYRYGSWVLQIEPTELVLKEGNANV